LIITHILDDDLTMLRRHIVDRLTEVEQQLGAPKAEPVSQGGGRLSEEEQGHSIGIGLA